MITVYTLDGTWEHYCSDRMVPSTDASEMIHMRLQLLIFKIIESKVV